MSKRLRLEEFKLLAYKLEALPKDFLSLFLVFWQSYYFLLPKILPLTEIIIWEESLSPADSSSLKLVYFDTTELSFIVLAYFYFAASLGCSSLCFDTDEAIIIVFLVILSSLGLFLGSVLLSNSISIVLFRVILGNG